MKLYKPKFWGERNYLSNLLIPLSFILQLYIFFKKKFSKIVNFKITVICVGNIYVGGTGKTPLSIYLAKELKKRGKKPAIVRKYYKDHKDEHSLIKENFEDLILNKNRDKAIREALQDKPHLLQTLKNHKPTRLRAKIRYDREGNAEVVKILESSYDDEVAKIFEKILESMVKIPNIASQLQDKNGRMTMHYYFNINTRSL